jgi:hypothetical protein
MDFYYRLQPTLSGKHFALQAAFVITAIVAPLTTYAATIAIPIDLTDQQAPLGHYLAADFDFGTTFSHVETMTLEFRLAQGYTSSAVGTGSSFSVGWLLAIVDEHGKQFTTDPMSLSLPAPSNATGLIKSVEDIAPHSIHDTVFGPPIVWPGALTGHGRVALIATCLTTFGPLNFGDRPPVASWGSLTEIDAVRLIVDGTPTPEPSTLLLAAITCIAGLYPSRKR